VSPDYDLLPRPRATNPVVWLLATLCHTCVSALLLLLLLLQVLLPLVDLL
jgi:hypothetical protein